MRTRVQRVALWALACLLLALSAWLLTTDVYAKPPEDFVGATRSFCGSAYDVVLLKGDGYMGGEVPVNQPEIDRQCVAASGRVVALGAALGGAGVTVVLGALVGTHRRVSPVIQSPRDDERA